MICPTWYETDKLVVKGNEACSNGADCSWGDGVYSLVVYYYIFDEYGYLSSAHIFYVFDSEDEAKEQYDNGLSWENGYYYCSENNIIVNRTEEDLEEQFGEPFEEITLGDITNHFENLPPWEVVYK